MANEKMFCTIFRTTNKSFVCPEIGHLPYIPESYQWPDRVLTTTTINQQPYHSDFTQVVQIITTPQVLSTITIEKTPE